MDNQHQEINGYRDKGFMCLIRAVAQPTNQ